MRLDAAIVSTPDDLHAQVVLQELNKLGACAAIIDSADYPQKIDLEYLVADTEQLTLRTISDGSLRLSRDTGIWWRRPQEHAISQSICHPKLKEFVRRECRQSFLGCLANHCHTFVNPHGASRFAAVKLNQFRAAKSCGFRVPHTLVTNDPVSAEAFIRQDPKKFIYKPFTGADFGVYETRCFDSPSDVDELWRLKDCPMIIQELVEGSVDLRVTVVGQKAFTASFDLMKLEVGVDSRIQRIRAEPFQLSPNCEIAVANLVHQLGLVYGALDFRIDRNGELVFFEVNPEGQYLWIEIDCGLPISAAMAALLLQRQQDFTVFREN